MYLQDQINNSEKIKIIDQEPDNLKMDLSLNYAKELGVKIGALYGNDITLKLFRKNFPVSELLLLSYDDIWLSQLITIDERAMLLKYQKNFTITLLDLLKKYKEVRVNFDAIIDSECGENELNDAVNYLLDKYNSIFEDKMLPHGKNKKGYLADVIQFLCAVEA